MPYAEDLGREQGLGQRHPGQPLREERLGAVRGLAAPAAHGLALQGVPGRDGLRDRGCAQVP
eukprot:8491252-Alexandrium_andersonii.AAC.1